VTAALEEERRERLTIMAAQAQAQEAMNLQELVSKTKPDVVAGAALSSSVTSQALHLRWCLIYLKRIYNF
jgi:hypothetical protein